jgi:hypothetical protein
MSFKNIDCLSPEITLFYYGNNRHATYCGSILTLLLIILSIFYIINLIINICNHEISSFMFYHNYITDSTRYYFNDTTGIFHFFQIYDINSKTFGKFNPKYARIIMYRAKEYHNNRDNIYSSEHWVYDLCRQGKDNKNIEKGVFNNNITKYFTNGACLRYYYNGNDSTYYPIEDEENFKYPYLLYGDGNNDEHLETVIEKCEDSSITNRILGSCGLQNDIDDYFQKYQGIYLQLLDKKLNENNYKKPVNQYMYGIESNINDDYIFINNINLIPFEIETKAGFVLPKTKRIKTYSFKENIKTTYESSNNKTIVSIYDFWIKNTGYVIKGRYWTIYDVLPNIGGFIQLFYLIFYCINYICNKYITLVDANDTFYRMANAEDPKDTLLQKILLDKMIFIRDEAKYREDSRLLAAMQKRDSIYITKKAREKKSLKSDNKSVDVNQDDILKKNYYSNTNIPHNLSNSNELMCNTHNNNNLNLNNNMTIVKSSKINNKPFENKYNIINEKLNIQFAGQLKEYCNRKNKKFKSESLKYESTILLFLNPYYYMMSLCKNNRDKYGFFYVLDKYRKKLISEEHLYKSNIISYYLEHYFDIKEEKKIDLIELYKNL